jgi:hypothetical protein
VTVATRAFTRRLSVPLLGLLLLLVSACTKEQSCKQTLNQLVCTESSQWPTWLTDQWPKSLPVLLIVAIFWMFDLLTDGKAEEPANTKLGLTAEPESILVPNIKVGDRIQDASGWVRVVRTVGWMSADELQVTWSDGGSQRFNSTATVIRLPPLQG